jgi:hypothetical protein
MSPEDRTMYQYFLLGNVLGIAGYSMIELYKYYTEDPKKQQIHTQNAKILSMRSVINLQLEEMELKDTFIKEQSEIIDEQSIEIEKKDSIIDELRSKHKKVRDKIVIEYEDED